MEETQPTPEQRRLFNKVREVHAIVRLSKNNELNYVLEKESAIKITKNIMMSLYDPDFFERYFSFDEYEEKIDLFLSLPELTSV